MLTLTRRVRFAINDDERSASGAPVRGPNGYAGVPAMRGLGRHYELDVSCHGRVNETTGYFINIKDIDSAVRAVAIPAIARACRGGSDGTAAADPCAVLREVFGPLDAALAGTVTGVRWWLTPYYSIEMERGNTNAVLLRQRFEFAASHRLHSPALSDEQNRSVYGKCNNPSGHGHNYIVEPAVLVRLNASGEGALTLCDLERLVVEHVIERFDHTHLNVDTPEFRTGNGLNPSVENIAKVCFDLLAPAMAASAPGGGATLRDVTVWETEKTSCTYPA